MVHHWHRSFEGRASQRDRQDKYQSRDDVKEKRRLAQIKRREVKAQNNIVPEDREMANHQKVHVYFHTRGDITTIKKTVNYDSVLSTSDVKKGFVEVEKLAEYPDCEVPGIGKLVPRMLHMWWDEYKGELPTVGVPGKKELKGDRQRTGKSNEDMLEAYWELHDRYNEWERTDQKVSDEEAQATLKRINRNVVYDALKDASN